MKRKSIGPWIIKGIAALIMLQTLYFKFTAQAESVQLFTILDMEPWGRIGIGVLELVASVLILIPVTSWLGALLGIGLMSGAIFFHVTKLGIAFNGSPQLFIYAVVVWVCCTLVFYAQRKQVPLLMRYIE
ncbi:MAG: DoxX family protein [Cyclobacteriaceae bacterium]|nr:DoxX family protein [Cyclobacteriaceae bacterium]